MIKKVANVFFLVWRIDKLTNHCSSRTKSCKYGGRKPGNSLVLRVLPEVRALLFLQQLPDKRMKGRILEGERETHTWSESDLLIQLGSKNPIIYSSPHCPGALVTHMGIERDDTRDFNPSSAERSGGWSQGGGRWPRSSPWTLPIYLVLVPLPYWIVALLTHLYSGHYRYSLSHKPSVLLLGFTAESACHTCLRAEYELMSYLGGGQSIAELCRADAKLSGDALW